jgi:CheY-like chemotaxis protein
LPLAKQRWQKVAACRPDLVLMDIRLKGHLDGVEAAEQIRVAFGTPVIYLTAYVDEATLQRAKITEPFGYIMKPFDERDLQVAIEIALRRRLSERAIRVALEKEKELSELRSRFWSMAAHELKSPMTSILICAQLLEQENHQVNGSTTTQIFIHDSTISPLDGSIVERFVGGWLRRRRELKV